MSGAETDMWDDHFDGFMDLFCAEFHASGGPGLDPAELERQVILYAVLMGITWLFDVPALIRVRVPDGGPATQPDRSTHQGSREFPRSTADAYQRFELWESRDLGQALDALQVWESASSNVRPLRKIDSKIAVNSRWTL